MQPSKVIAIISSQAASLVLFRAPLLRELALQGHTVLALAPDFDEATRSEVERLGGSALDYPLSRTGMNPFQDGRSMFQLARILRAREVDVTLSYFIKPVIFGTLAAWLAGAGKRVAMIEGLGYVFTPSHSSSEPFRRKALRALVSWLYKCALSKSDTVIFLNQDDLDEFCSKKIVRRIQTLKLGGIGVDLHEWPAAPAITQPVTFLMTARLLCEKGVHDFVSAARATKLRHPTTRFILLGSLDANPGSISLDEVSSWVKEGVLEWPGHVPVQDWLAQASVYVLPSYREGVPRSTQEALAMARPVITTDAPGCRDTVVDGENGFLVPVRDPKALENAMEYFILHPERIAPMGAASRALAEQRFDSAQKTRRLLNILNAPVGTREIA